MSAFVTPKERLVTAIVLIRPDFDKQFILSTDASLQGLGAVLEQYGTDPNRPHPIQYASVFLSKAQSNYSITELKGVAIVWAITKFRHYLSTQPFKLIADHSVLKYILMDKGTVLTGQLARWKRLLQEYPYECDRPGL